MLPKTIEDLILHEFHDAFNTIDNRKRVNFIIECGYRNWLSIKTTSNMRLYNRHEREYLGKLSIWLPNPFYYFSWIGFEPVYPMPGEWDLFLRHFQSVDEEFRRKKLKVSQLDLII
jgi:hypothetical protein